MPAESMPRKLRRALAQVAQEAEQSFVIVVGVGLFDVPEHEDQIAENVGDDAGLRFLAYTIDKVYCSNIHFQAVRHPWRYGSTRKRGDRF